MPVAAEPIPPQITAACQVVRPATPADAVAGMQPWLVAAPSSTQEASDLLRAAAALGLAVVPRGTGSRMHWGYPPSRCDLVIEMTRMDAIMEHAAGDLVATVQAGLSLGKLAEVLAGAGQRLTLDPPAWQQPSAPGQEAKSGGTVGGVLATGVAGPLRLRYGSGRDLLIGITFVRPDGTVAKSGGKVVKNVAGFDLGKLFAGSRGTLGLITSATFRLHPVPAATACVSAQVSTPAQAALLLLDALGAALSPVSAEISWPAASAPIEIAVAVEGEADGVTERASALSTVLTGHAPAGATASPPQQPPWWGRGPLAQADGTVLQVAFWPGDLAGVLTRIREAAHQAGLDPAVGGSAAAGVVQASLPPDRDPGAIAAFVGGLRAALGDMRAAAGGQPGPSRTAQPGEGAPSGPDEGPPDRSSVVVLHAPPAVGALVDMFGPVPSLPVMRAVKHQFDPDNMMSPGRFAGGI
jgi:glycolate oxidase FAD binding subunit